MKKALLTIPVLMAFVLGAWWGIHAAKPGITPSMWEGDPKQAAGNLLEAAGPLTDDGSWENIHLGRVYYLSGDTERAEAIFSRYTGASKPTAGDLVRIARVYAQAGDWDKAAPLYERVIELKPKDTDWIIEAGAFYNLNGNRERAEELFAMGFGFDNRNLKNALSAAGSYVGVEPRKR